MKNIWKSVLIASRLNGEGTVGPKNFMKEKR